MATYLVIGTQTYRGHKPGDTFVATLEADELRRAVGRGSIRVLDDKPVTLDRRRVRKPRSRGSSR